MGYHDLDVVSPTRSASAVPNPRFQVALGGICSIAGGDDVACKVLDLSLGGSRVSCASAATIAWRRSEPRHGKGARTYQWKTPGLAVALRFTGCRDLDVETDRPAKNHRRDHFVFPRSLKSASRRKRNDGEVAASVVRRI